LTSRNLVVVLKKHPSTRHRLLGNSQKMSFFCHHAGLKLCHPLNNSQLINSCTTAHQTTRVSCASDRFKSPGAPGAPGQPLFSDQPPPEAIFQPTNIEYCFKDCFGYRQGSDKSYWKLFHNLVTKACYGDDQHIDFEDTSNEQQEKALFVHFQGSSSKLVFYVILNSCLEIDQIFLRH
jgi:hypothetical protein